MARSELERNLLLPHEEDIRSGWRTRRCLQSDYVPVTDIDGTPIVNGVTGQPLTLFSFQPTDPTKYGAFNFLVTNIPQLDDNSYHGVEFTAVKRLSHKWQILGGFTIQRQKGVFARAYSDDAFQDNFTDPNLDINRKDNYLNSDATYIFKVDSSYEFPLQAGGQRQLPALHGLPDSADADLRRAKRRKAE